MWCRLFTHVFRFAKAEEANQLPIDERIGDRHMATRSILTWPKFQAKNRQREDDYVIFNKTARTLLFFALFVTLPYGLPGLNRYRLLPFFKFGRTNSVEQGIPSQSQDVDAREGRAGVANGNRKPGEIEDPTGNALDSFFAALLKTEVEGKQTRICHYGDSPITNDGITSTVRKKFQQQFGDAGHGFVLTAKPWGWYEHKGVAMEASGAWRSDPMFISRGDHLFGLGGASFTTSAANATATFNTIAEGDIKHSVTAFDIYYLTQPNGGEFDVEIDGAKQARISTANHEMKSAFYRVETDEGAHTLTIRTIGNSEVRMFGVALENRSQGVTYDSLGVNGAFIGLLANDLDEQHWTEQLRHRKPDLVIIGYGANESQFESLDMNQYERDTREVVRRLRQALPEASIMLVGPMDRGLRGAGGQIVTRPMIKKLVAYQRRLAAELDCAFFDTFTAMGGEGTVAKWFAARPRLMGGDFTHPTAQGSEIVGSLIYEAMVNAYEEYKTRRIE
jgi:lysophospholipase L1-like esterase